MAGARPHRHPGRAPRPWNAFRAPPGLRLLRQLPREGGDVGALRVDRVHTRHRPGHRLAARALLVRCCIGFSGGNPVRRGGLEGGEEMKAVVMAGGEGTRLRPLTSNQPKPMVPIVGKPCMEHIVELLRAHDFEDVIVTVAFMPQAIRSYFGDGESLDMDVDYSVEEQPLGTAGSVKLAERRLDETFLVISGDALCDGDLTSLVAAHRE